MFYHPGNLIVSAWCTAWAAFFTVQVMQRLTPVQIGHKLKEQCFPMQPSDAVSWQWSRSLLRFRPGFWTSDSWQ